MSGTDENEDTFLAGLGRRVRTMRTVRGMSRKALSQSSGLSERYIAQLEGGHGNVSIILLRRVANAMGMRLEDLTAADSPPDWPAVRDLLRTASQDQIGRAKRALTGDIGGGEMPPRVALIGLRGAGKSTLGRLVADRLGWSFVELNREIERDTGLSVGEIFAIYGQEGFRRLEQTTTRRLAEQQGPVILATGGSIVAEPLTFELLLSAFFTVWLQAEAPEHLDRILRQGDPRPRVEGSLALQELRAVLISREPLYSRAKAVVNTSGLTVAETANRLADVVETRFGRLRPQPTALAHLTGG